MFVAFFAVVAAENGVFITLAIKTMPGVVTEHAYEKGLAYNQTLEAAQEQEKTGLQGTTTYKDGVLSFSFKHKKNGAPVSGAKVTAKIIRPVTEGHGMDAALLEEGKSGVYMARIALPMQGLWEVKVFSEWQGQSFATSTQLSIP